MKRLGRELLVEYAFLLLPVVGLVVIWQRPDAWPLSAVATVIATLPLFMAAMRGALDRRFEVETFHVAAVVLLLVDGRWAEAAVVTLALVWWRRVEYAAETRRETRLAAKLPTPNEVRHSGEVIALGPGEVIPADGTIVRGAAFVLPPLRSDRRPPIERLVGDPVFAGTRVKAGSVRMRVRRVGEEALIASMRRAVLEASRRPSRGEHAANNAAAFSIWCVTLLAGGAWLAFGDLRAVAAILLVLRPETIRAGMAQATAKAAERVVGLGAIPRGNDSLDALADADAVAFDKNGPRSYTELRVRSVEHDPAVSDALVWECLAVAEGPSDHPAGRALYREAIRHVGRIIEPDSFDAHPGRGVVAELEGHHLVVGTAELLRSHRVALDGAWLAGSTTPIGEAVFDVFLALDGTCLARIRIEECSRPDVRHALDGLRHAGVKHHILLTPDTIRIATRQARLMGLDDYRPSTEIEGAAKELGRLAREGKKVLLIGDGIRGAAAMERAHVAVAIAPDGSIPPAAGIVLVEDDLDVLPELILLGRAFRRAVWRAYIAWLLFGAVGLGLAFAGLLSPVVATAYAAGTALAIRPLARISRR